MFVCVVEGAMAASTKICLYIFDFFYLEIITLILNPLIQVICLCMNVSVSVYIYKNTHIPTHDATGVAQQLYGYKIQVDLQSVQTHRKYELERILEQL